MSTRCGCCCGSCSSFRFRVGLLRPYSGDVVMEQSQRPAALENDTVVGARLWCLAPPGFCNAPGVLDAINAHLSSAVAPCIHADDRGRQSVAVDADLKA